jgi:ppGpp synthetase/RelA/SpoT-type nucleotidyltranferase
LLNRKKDAVTVAAVDAVDFQQSSEGYNSIHYVVNVDGKYIEIQVRTLLDEAWAECTHDIVYKNIKNKSQIMELQYLSNCLAQQTTSAEMISNLIYEKVYKNGLIYGGVKHSEKKNEPPDKNQTDMGCEVERRMQLLQELSNKSFGGNTDEFL